MFIEIANRVLHAGSDHLEIQFDIRNHVVLIQKSNGNIPVCEGTRPNREQLFKGSETNASPSQRVLINSNDFLIAQDLDCLGRDLTEVVGHD